MKFTDILMYTLIFLIFVGTGIAFIYQYMLLAFFKELREQEPEVWQKIGSPTAANMLFLPFINFRKFYAFLDDLTKRRKDPNFHYAGKAYFMLIFGLSYFLILIVGVLVLALSGAS